MSSNVNSNFPASQPSSPFAQPGVDKAVSNMQQNKLQFSFPQANPVSSIGGVAQPVLAKVASEVLEKDSESSNVNNSGVAVIHEDLKGIKDPYMNENNNNNGMNGADNEDGTSYYDYISKNSDLNSSLVFDNSNNNNSLNDKEINNSNNNNSSNNNQVKNNVMNESDFELEIHEELQSTVVGKINGKRSLKDRVFFFGNQVMNTLSNAITIRSQRTELQKDGSLELSKEAHQRWKDSPYLSCVEKVCMGFISDATLKDAGILKEGNGTVKNFLVKYFQGAFNIGSALGGIPLGIVQNLGVPGTNHGIYKLANLVDGIVTFLGSAVGATIRAVVLIAATATLVAGAVLVGVPLALGAVAFKLVKGVAQALGYVKNTAPGAVKQAIENKAEKSARMKIEKENKKVLQKMAVRIAGVQYELKQVPYSNDKERSLINNLWNDLNIARMELDKHARELEVTVEYKIPKHLERRALGGNTKSDGQFQAGEPIDMAKVPLYDRPSDLIAYAQQLLKDVKEFGLKTPKDENGEVVKDKPKVYSFSSEVRQRYLNKKSKDSEKRNTNSENIIIEDSQK